MWFRLVAYQSDQGFNTVCIKNLLPLVYTKTNDNNNNLLALNVWYEFISFVYQQLLRLLKPFRFSSTPCCCYRMVVSVGFFGCITVFCCFQNGLIFTKTGTYLQFYISNMLTRVLSFCQYQLLCIL